MRTFTTTNAKAFKSATFFAPPISSLWPSTDCFWSFLFLLNSHHCISNECYPWFSRGHGMNILYQWLLWAKSVILQNTYYCSYVFFPLRPISLLENTGRWFFSVIVFCWSDCQRIISTFLQSLNPAFNSVSLKSGRGQRTWFTSKGNLF